MAETGAEARLGKSGRRNQSEHVVVAISVCGKRNSVTRLRRHEALGRKKEAEQAEKDPEVSKRQ